MSKLMPGAKFTTQSNLQQEQYFVSMLLKTTNIAGEKFLDLRRRPEAESKQLVSLSLPVVDLRSVRIIADFAFMCSEKKLTCCNSITHKEPSYCAVPVPFR